MIVLREIEDEVLEGISRPEVQACELVVDSLNLKPDRVASEVEYAVTVVLQQLESHHSSNHFYEIDVRVGLILDSKAIFCIFGRICHNCLVAHDYFMQHRSLVPGSRDLLLADL